MNTSELLTECLRRTKVLVNKFNRKHMTSLVHLVLENSNGLPTFSIRFNIHDKFIDGKYYRDGSAYIYVTDSLYAEIEKLAGGKINYNNFGSTGWLSLTEVNDNE